MNKVVPSMSRPPKRTASRKESLPAEPAKLSGWWELAIANKDLLLVEGVPVIPVAEAPANHWMNKAVQLQSCVGVDTHFYEDSELQYSTTPTVLASGFGHMPLADRQAFSQQWLNDSGWFEHDPKQGDVYTDPTGILPVDMVVQQDRVRPEDCVNWIKEGIPPSLLIPVIVCMVDTGRSAVLPTLDIELKAEWKKQFPTPLASQSDAKTAVKVWAAARDGAFKDPFARTSSTGIRVLLRGAPGTGKTQLAVDYAATIKRPHVIVDAEVNSSEYLSMLATAEKADIVVIFDESARLIRYREDRTSATERMLRALEDYRHCAVFFTTNLPKESIEPAMLDRCTDIFNVLPPTRKELEQAWRAYAKENAVTPLRLSNEVIDCVVAKQQGYRTLRIAAEYTANARKAGLSCKAAVAAAVAAITRR